MAKRKNPKTSMDAYRNVAPEMVNRHHSKIIAALRMVNNGMIYEQIAAYTQLEKHQVGRRLKELVKLELLYAVKDDQGKEVTRLTASNHPAQVWKLTKKGEMCEIHLPGKTVSQYSKDIQAVQLNLL